MVYLSQGLARLFSKGLTSKSAYSRSIHDDWIMCEAVPYYMKWCSSSLCIECTYLSLDGKYAGVKWQSTLGEEDLRRKQHHHKPEATVVGLQIIQEPKSQDPKYFRYSFRQHPFPHDLLTPPSYFSSAQPLFSLCASKSWASEDGSLSFLSFVLSRIRPAISFVTFGSGDMVLCSSACIWSCDDAEVEWFVCGILVWN